MTIIEKIKAEIERRLKEYWEISFHDTNSYNKDTNVKELKELLSFISTLESENPVLNDLEEAAVDIADVLLAKPKEYALSAKADYWNGVYDGVIAGAKWQAEQDTRDMFMSDNRHFNKVYELGKKDMKEQMMKEAVEGTVHNFSSYKPHPTVLVDANGFNQGDKVRVIVLPKED